MRTTLLWVASLSLSVALLGVTVPRAVRSSEMSAAAERDLAQTAALVHELGTLRAAPAPTSVAASGLQPRLSAVLAACALPSTTLQSLAPEPEVGQRNADGATIRRRRATVVLQGLTLLNLGRFLEGWRTAEPSWVIASIDLTQTGSAAPGSDLPVRAALVLERTSIEVAQVTATPLDAVSTRSAP